MRIYRATCTLCVCAIEANFPMNHERCSNQESPVAVISPAQAGPLGVAAENVAEVAGVDQHEAGQAQVAAPQEKLFLTRQDQDNAFPDTKKGNRRGEREAKEKRQRKAAKAKASPKKKIAKKPKGKKGSKEAEGQDSNQAKRKRESKEGPKRSKGKGTGKGQGKGNVQAAPSPAQEQETREASALPSSGPNNGRNPGTNTQPNSAPNAAPKSQPKAAAKKARSKPTNRVVVRQDWTHAYIVVYWTKNSVGVKIRATNQQACAFHLFLHRVLKGGVCDPRFPYIPYSLNLPKLS